MYTVGVLYIVAVLQCYYNNYMYMYMYNIHYTCIYTVYTRQCIYCDRSLFPCPITTLMSPSLPVWVKASTDVRVQCPPLCVCMTCSVWTQSAEVTGSAGAQSAPASLPGPESRVPLSTALPPTAVGTATAVMVCVHTHVLSTGIGVDRC